MEILNSADNTLSKMLEDDKNDVKPLFRSKEWNKDERKESKINKKSNWYKNRGKSQIKYKSVIFVPPTPGGILVKDMKKRETEVNNDGNERIKFVEKDPFAKEKWSQKLCPICKNEFEKISILSNSNNAGYGWTCVSCQIRGKGKVYEGETSRSARLRCIKHVKSYNGKKKTVCLTSTNF